MIDYIEALLTFDSNTARDLVLAWIGDQEYTHEYAPGEHYVVGRGPISREVVNGNYSTWYTDIRLGDKLIILHGSFDYLIDEMLKLIRGKGLVSATDAYRDPIEIPALEELEVALYPGVGLFDARVFSVWRRLMEWDHKALQDPDKPGRWFLGHTDTRSELAMADWRDTGRTSRATVLTLAPEKVEVVGPLDIEVAFFLCFLKKEHPEAFAKTMDGAPIPWPGLEGLDIGSYFDDAE